MAAWFSKKPRLTPRGQYPPEILRAIHTMADDLNGGQNQSASVSDEPLVAFQPDQAEGAAFYAAPEMLEPVASTSTEPMEASAPSPFLSEPPAALPVIEDTAPVAPVPPNELSPLPLAPTEDEQLLAEDIIVKETPSPTSSPLRSLLQYKKWILFGFGLLFLLAALGLAWYWWQHQKSSSAPPVMGDGPVKSTPPPQVEVKITEEKPDQVHYSVSQPNLLSFDTETVTADAIRTELLKVALSIKQDNLHEPAEFLIRDQSYNPLAFSRFAYLLGLNLDPDLLASLDETFSLFFYLDQDHPRIGLQLTVKNKQAFTISLKKGENTLPKAFEPLFLDTTTAPKTGLTFHSGLYHEQAVRYVNVDTTMLLSIDHAVRGDKWLIGTSQNTLRAILDHDPAATENASQ